MTLRIIHERVHLREALDAHRLNGRTIGVVPTMGALHEGHLSLVRAAKREADVVVVTIFVNPTQFGPNEDFDKYPRALAQDADLVAAQGADLVFSPAVEEMYPNGEQTRVRVTELSLGLCGAHRPGHFEGVLTVVAKFFSLIGAGVYFFGEKDYQQLRVIERMARDLLFPVRIVGCPIVRQEDGLALSSRNVYLSQHERQVALGLSAGLFGARSAYALGERHVGELVRVAQRIINEHARDGIALQVEYLEIRDADDLAEAIADATGLITPRERRVVLLVAARLGSTRLIDNILLE
jgi:pantoate--beta-alanine ligase